MDILDMDRMHKHNEGSQAPIYKINKEAKVMEVKKAAYEYMM